MHHPEYSSVDPETGNINYRGNLSIEKGDHSYMPFHSERIALVNGKAGERPTAFLVNDTVIYPDSRAEIIFRTFTKQDAWNEMSLDDTFAEDYPMDELRSFMDAESYAALMEEMDAYLPSILDDYASSGHSILPGAETGSAILAQQNA